MAKFVLAAIVLALICLAGYVSGKEREQDPERFMDDPEIEPRSLKALVPGEERNDRNVSESTFYPSYWRSYHSHSFRTYLKLKKFIGHTWN